MFYVTDGSQKGNVVGAGVVFVNDAGKQHEFSFAKVLPNATSSMAEAFALECAFDLFIGINKPPEKPVIFYVDHQDWVSCLNNLNCSYYPSELYVFSVMKQMSILRKFRNVTVEQLGKDKKDLAKRAHELSRVYLNDDAFAALVDIQQDTFKAENYPTVRLKK